MRYLQSKYQRTHFDCRGVCRRPASREWTSIGHFAGPSSFETALRLPNVSGTVDVISSPTRGIDPGHRLFHGEAWRDLNLPALGTRVEGVRGSSPLSSTEPSLAAAAPTLPAATSGTQGTPMRSSRIHTLASVVLRVIASDAADVGGNAPRQPWVSTHPRAGR